LIPLLRAALAKQPEFDDSSAKAGKLLLDWDFRLSGDSAAAALYEVWNHNLSSRMVRQIAVADGGADGQVAVRFVADAVKPEAIDVHHAVRMLDAGPDGEGAIARLFADPAARDVASWAAGRRLAPRRSAPPSPRPPGARRSPSPAGSRSAACCRARPATSG